MTHFPGESNTRNNLLAYKYTGKNPQISDHLVVSKMDLNVGTEDMNAWSSARSSVRSFYKLYEVLFVLSTNSTKFCSFAQQKWTFVLYVWSSTERGYDQYDQHKYDCSSNWWLKHPCCSNGPCIMKRHFFS